MSEEYDTCYLPDRPPDGASLVFGCSDEQSGQGIYTMVVDGGYPRWRP